MYCSVHFTGFTQALCFLRLFAFPTCFVFFFLLRSCLFFAPLFLPPVVAPGGFGETLVPLFAHAVLSLSNLFGRSVHPTPPVDSSQKPAVFPYVSTLARDSPLEPRALPSCQPTALFSSSPAPDGRNFPFRPSLFFLDELAQTRTIDRGLGNFFVAPPFHRTFLVISTGFPPITLFSLSAETLPLKVSKAPSPPHLVALQPLTSSPMHYRSF